METDEAAIVAGKQAAQADIAAGRLQYRWTGHAGHWGHYFVMQLEERFGVSVTEGFGVCFTTSNEESFNEGYNCVLVDEIKRRFGAGSFESMLIDVKSRSDVELAAAREAWLEQNGQVEDSA